MIKKLIITALLCVVVTGAMAQKAIEKPEGATVAKGHAYVDLGLSVKWAACNVGASKPEEYGEYYAWGETKEKKNYTEGNSKTKGIDTGDISGNANYDAARANWGGAWRMPTKREMQELVDNCNWIWTKQGGVNGYKVVSKKNGNSIFLPAAGFRMSASQISSEGSYGRYWTSTPYGEDANGAVYLNFNDEFHTVNWYSRHYGRPIRAVRD